MINPWAGDLADLGPDSVAVMGVPIDANSSHVRGAADAPDAIRRAQHSGSSNDTSERGVDVSRIAVDVGDVSVTNEVGSLADMELVERVALTVVESGSAVVGLGGDHSVSPSLVAAAASRHGPLTIVHVDAHPDLYDDFEGNPLSHASPFARIMERGTCARLIQVGIRTATAHQRQQAERFGIETIEPWRLDELQRHRITGPTYVSIDLDGLDPAFAPGVSHHEPGGLSTRDVLDLVHSLAGPIVGADVVELNPERDVMEITAAVAATFVKSLVAAIASRR